MDLHPEDPYAEKKKKKRTEAVVLSEAPTWLQTEQPVLKMALKPRTLSASQLLRPFSRL